MRDRTGPGSWKDASLDWPFPCLFEYLPIEFLADKEAGPVAECIEQGTDLLDLAKSLGFEEYTQNSHRAKTEASRCMATFLLIEQDDPRFELDRQRESLSLTAVEISSKDHYQISVAHVVVLDP